MYLVIQIREGEVFVYCGDTICKYPDEYPGFRYYPSQFGDAHPWLYSRRGAEKVADFYGALVWEVNDPRLVSIRNHYRNK